jgi:hypothetical protein
VLVEGPADATPLIPLLLDPATVPPVALYTYRTGEGTRAAFFPFCTYSPEYVALKAGQEIGARLEFCDLPAAVTLDDRDADGEEVPSGAASDYAAFTSALAESAGFETFEEFWEAAFEQDAGTETAGGYIGVMADFGGKARALTSPTHDARDAARERHMAAVARSVIEGGIPVGDVLLVCGAAHARAVAEAFRAGDDARAASAGDPGAPFPTPHSPLPAEIVLIPYSFPRLSEQSGYGAGNRAPWYYQQVWNRRGDYASASRFALVTLGQHLRRQGFAASLAQCIDAETLATVLAGMRGKAGPGVDEVGEAAVACFGEGNAAVVAEALRQVLIGDAVGQVTHRVGRTPLQAEFYATANRHRLPVQDMPRQVLLHMTTPAEAEQSVFLHRLKVAGVPFAREIEGGLGGRGRAAQGGALEHLARVREKWELQWSPSTDAALIEQTAWGSTLAEACGRLLGRRLESSARIDDGTTVLLEMALCDLSGALPAALDRCEALAADSGSFPALARATYQLDGLLSYGSARRLPTDRLGDLARRLFTRAVLHLPASVRCGDEAAAEVSGTLTTLYELVRRRSPVAGDPEPFWDAVRAVAGLPGSHAGLRGLALVLLELGGVLAEGELAQRLRYWLSVTAEAGDNARLVAGLFTLNRGTLLRNRGLIAAVTGFMNALEIEELTPLLPVLRRRLGDLSPAERVYLAETLERVLGLAGGDAARTLGLSSADELLLREADAAVAAVLAEWGSRYGIE